MGIKIGRNVLNHIAKQLPETAGLRLDNGVYLHDTEDGGKIYLLRTGKFVKIQSEQVIEIEEQDVNHTAARVALDEAIEAAISSRAGTLSQLRRAKRLLNEDDGENKASVSAIQG